MEVRGDEGGLRISEFSPGSLSEEALSLLSHSVDPATSRAREKDFALYKEYVAQRKCSISPQSVASFLSARFFACGWSAGRVEQARSNIVAGVALAYGQSWSNDPCISRTIRACSRIRPKASRYNTMWDLRIMYSFYQNLPGDDRRVVARRKAMVLVRASLAGRTKDVLSISRRSLSWDQKGATFQFFAWKTQHTSAQSRALSKPHRLDYLSLPDAAWCAARALQRYISLNQAHYDSPEASTHDMVWTHYNSGEPLKVSTARLDCKKDMSAAGVPNIYGPGTIRHAAISLWHSLGVSREEVARRTGHRSLAIISVYYDKSVASDLGPQLASQMRPPVPAQEPWDSTRSVRVAKITAVLAFLFQWVL